jgi:hypothetical protein
MRNVARRSRVGAFAQAVAARIVVKIRGFLRELSGERAYRNLPLLREYSQFVHRYYLTVCASSIYREGS